MKGYQLCEKHPSGVLIANDCIGCEVENLRHDIAERQGRVQELEAKISSLQVERDELTAQRDAFGPLEPCHGRGRDS